MVGGPVVMVGGWTRTGHVKKRPCQERLTADGLIDRLIECFDLIE
jgi:hypothetical protein